MSANKFTDEFKRDAVAQVEDRGYSVREVAERLGVSTKSIYTWQKQFSRPAKVIQEVDAQAEEIRRLKRDLLRVTEERDILKKATAYFARESPLLAVCRQTAAGQRVRYAFNAEHRLMFAVRAMCRMLLVHPSGFYAWLREPLSQRALEDKRQTVLLKQAWDDSGEVYGYSKLHDDLCDLGEDISPNRAWRLARLAGIRAEIGYKKKPGSYGGSPAVVADNTLNREFDVDAPDQFWVTDITYIRTHEGFLYLAVVIDLFSRRVVGWSMQGRTYTDLPLQALLMAVWRRKPKTKVQVHSDQGSQFTSYEWQEFLEQHNLTQSMSRRGNCWDNAVAESFFNLLKRERIRRRKYKTREEARQDVFDYIEFFYNPQRKHVRNGMLSPIDFEQRQKLKLQGV